MNSRLSILIEQDAMMIYAHLRAHGEQVENKLQRALGLTARRWKRARHKLFTERRIATVGCGERKKYIALERQR